MSLFLDCAFSENLKVKVIAAINQIQSWSSQVLYRLFQLSCHAFWAVIISYAFFINEVLVSQNN